MNVSMFFFNLQWLYEVQFGVVITSHSCVWLMPDMRLVCLCTQQIGNPGGSLGRRTIEIEYAPTAKNAKP